MHRELTDEEKKKLQERLESILLQDLPEILTDHDKTQPIWGADD